MINISPYKKCDYIQLVQIEKVIFKNRSLESELKIYEKQEYYFVWKIEIKKIIGFISFLHVQDEIEILKIGIIKSYRGNNYGSKLIDEIKKLKIKKIFLEVSIQNVNAINFYFKNGFKKIGVRKGYYASNNSSRIDALRLMLKV